MKLANIFKTKAKIEEENLVLKDKLNILNLQLSKANDEIAVYKNRNIRINNSELNNIAENKTDILDWIVDTLIPCFNKDKQKLNTDFPIIKKGTGYIVVTERCQYCQKPLSSYYCHSYHEALVLGYILNSMGIHPKDSWCDKCTNTEDIFHNYICSRCALNNTGCDWCFSKNKQ